jgi:hypothetical protein
MFFIVPTIMTVIPTLLLISADVFYSSVCVYVRGIRDRDSPFSALESRLVTCNAHSRPACLLSPIPWKLVE